MKIEHIPIIDRLNMRTIINTQGCWEWQGACTDDGYGVISYQGLQRRVHILSYLHHKGEVPFDHLVCHTCDNPPCWNPDHLFCGTHQDNTQDMWSKNRQGKHIRGRKLGESSALTEDDIRNIRIELAKGRTGADIGREFLVTRVMISRIKLGKAWSWVQ